MVLFSKIYVLSGANIWDKTVNWYQTSMIKELLTFLDTQVFHINPTTYDHFSLTERTGDNIKNIVLGLVIGMILASAAAYYTRAVQGKFVRELLKRECLSPETAITLRECGFFCNPTIRRELKNGGALSRVAMLAEPQENADAPIDFLSARYYIPEETKYRAEFRFQNRGFSPFHVILVAVIGIAAGVAVFRILPSLLGLADGLLTLLG